MKILFLPHNTASLPLITAEALNKIEGVQAICLSIDHSKYLKESKVLRLIKFESKKNFIKWVLSKLNYIFEIKRLIKWADIVFYTWGPGLPFGIDVKYAKSKRKPLFIEWFGSDVRIPEMVMEINPYYKSTFYNGYEYAEFESKKRSIRTQKLFSRNKATPILCYDLHLFIQSTLFPKFHTIYQRINLEEFDYKFPDPNILKPLIIHFPSAVYAKGTNLILPIIEDLQKKYNFEFKVFHNIPREQVLKEVLKADIIIDQIICGSYGMAAVEAMTMGKPVMCYLMPKLFEIGLSKECPIVNSNPDNLKENLKELISNSSLRTELGKKSRLFVEKYHDSTKIARQLIEIFQEALQKGKC